MDLYIGNIPKGARTAELKKLVKDTLRENVFSGMFDRLAHLGRLDNGISIAIHSCRDQLDAESYRYGHIKIDSRNLARVVLENIGSASLRGESLSVREYVERDNSRDRRYGGNDWQGEERRSTDRRHA